MITSATLSDPDRGLSLILNPRPGVLAFHGLEITPTVRVVSEDWAQMDGALDTTQWLSAAAVTVNVTVLPNQPGLLDQLTAFCVPWARPYLVVTDTDWPNARQIQLRADPWQHPLDVRQGPPRVREVQLAFTAPRGMWEDTITQFSRFAVDIADSTGMVFTGAGVAVSDLAGYVFPPSTSSGSTIVTVPGNARPAWRARLYGPCTGPALSNDTTGQSLVFSSSLTLNPGDYLELNSGPGPLARSANLLGQADASRLQFMDFTASEWFPLDPGPNKVRYHPVTAGSVAAVCELTVYPVWLP